MKLGLIGRTNVGKSTLFNKLLGNHRAIITDIAGTTRELLHDTVDLGGKQHTLIDSPGLERFEQERPFLEQIIQESDMLLFVVDGKVEPSQQDVQIRDMLIDAGMKDKTLLIVNKLDGKVYDDSVYSLLAEWYSRGFENLLPISAEQLEGIERIRQCIAKQAEIHIEEDQDDDAQKPLPIAIIGRPNVGKSTLLNTLTGERIAHVSDVAGTTLDYLVGEVDFKGKPFQIYDTAGIRKRGRTVGLEKIAYSKTISLLQYKRPAVVLLIDLVEGLTKRDAGLFGEMEQLGLPMVLACNKIDEMEPKEKDMLVKQLRARHSFLEWVPIVSISGKEAIGIAPLLEKVTEVYRKRGNHIPTSQLNKALTKAWLISPPRFPKNKICKWKYIAQVDQSPPRFLLSVNNAQYANFSFKKRVKNVIRKEFDLSGVPIKLSLDSKTDDNPYV